MKLQYWYKLIRKSKCVRLKSQCFKINTQIN